MNEPKTSIEGRLIHIGEIQTFPSGFSKRQIVIETGGKYPQQVPVELLKDNAARIEPFQVGDGIRVECNIRGNENKGRWYVSITGWRLEKLEGIAEHKKAPDPGVSPKTEIDLGDSDIPF